MAELAAAAGFTEISRACKAARPASMDREQAQGKTGGDNMRVLFLDIDGVLNSQAWYKERERETSGINSAPHDFFPKEPQRLRRKLWDLDPKAMETLKRIVTDYEFKVVISSGDRIGESVEYFNHLFKLRGCEFVHGTIIGMTPCIGTDHRGDEIEAWLQSSAPCQYLIIDDRSDFHHYQKPHWIQTDRKTGLQEWHHEIVGLHLERDKAPA